MNAGGKNESEPHVHGPNCNHDHDHHHAHQVPATRTERPGRNDPCWCGSEVKYKKCHLQSDSA